MALFKKNIWIVFNVITIVGLFLFFIISYFTYSQTVKSFENEQENILQITTKSINSIFLQYEMLLDLLGNELILNEKYKSIEESKNTLDNLLESNSSITAFGLARPNGQLYTTSSNLKNIKKLPNLLEKEETKDSFLYTLKNTKMVIGRTYFHKTLNTLIFPIRKTIRDEAGNPISIMTAGINVSKVLKNINVGNNKIFIHREFDNFNQLTEQSIQSNLSTYKKPLPKDFINTILKKVKNKYNFSSNDMMKNSKVVSIKTKRFFSDEKLLMSIQYIPRYELWFMSSIPYSYVSNILIKRISIIFLIFILINIVIYYLVRIIDKSEKRRYKILEHQTTHDYLTGLNNRLFLSEIFPKLNKSKSFSLFFVDIDNFKVINDTYGHDYGDKILVEISHRLLSYRKKEDFIIRFSGDEFLIITYRTVKSEIKELASNILARLSEPYYIEQYKFKLSASIGISQYPLDSESYDKIKRYADMAMYESKKIRNSYTIFEDTIKHEYFKLSIIEREIKESIDNNEISMMYQPQIKEDGSFYGVEALVRWENKTLGSVSPDKFIPIAESTGFMNKLGQFIIDKSLNEIYSLQKDLNVDFQLSINISIKQFVEVNFYKNIIKAIKQANFSKIKITLEVTENIFIEDFDYITSLLYKLKKYGIKISLDDFGTGYSSLSLLVKLPVDELKIDKSFIDDILTDESSKNMVESIISIGKKFDMSILAEGVESYEQQEILSSYNCDYFQGYYFSKPLKINELKKFIINYKSI